MRSKLSLFLAAVLAATLLQFGGAAGALVPAVVDLSSSVTGEPASVSPVGGVVLYRATFENLSALPAPAVFSDTTDAGTYVAALSKIPAGCSAPADGSANPVISCQAVLQPASPVVIEVAVRTPAVAGVLTNTSTIAVDPAYLDDVVDANGANDTSSVATPVLDDPNSSSALVREGESISFGPHLVTVTDADNGIVIMLAEALGGGDTCGPKLCGNGLHLDFGTDPDRQGYMQVELNFTTDPCRGIGADKCTAIYERKFDGTPDETITPVPSCTALPSADTDTTCLISVAKVGPNFRHLVRMYSEDPDLIPVGTLELN